MMVWLGVVLAAGWSPRAHAEDATFSPEAQVRPRWEADTGRDGAPGSGAVSYITMRSRLGGTLTREGVSVRVVVADVRTLGEEADTRRDFSADGLDVPIAVLGWTVGPWQLAAGRMQETLLNERLLAVANWRQPGRSFDGARLRYLTDHHTLEVRALLLEEGDIHDFPTSDQVLEGEGDRTLFTLCDTIRLPAARLSWSPVAIYDRSAKTEGAYDRLTAGMLVESTDEAAPFSLVAEGYGQLTRADETPTTVGWMAGATAGLTGTHRLAPRIALQHEVLSGTAPDNPQRAAFNTLYGANHRYYGNIDVSVCQAGGYRDGQGLHDTALELGLSPAESVEVTLDLHAFLAARPADTSAFLAVEPDLSVQARLRPGLTASAGGSVWLPPEATGTEVMGWAMLDARL